MKSYITPDPGRLNCSGCHRLNQPKCAGGCHRCSQCCLCTNCPECKTIHPSNICRVCQHCRRGSACMCKGKPRARALPTLTSRHLLTRRAVITELNRPLTFEAELASIRPPRNGAVDPWGLKVSLPEGKCPVHMEHDGSIHGPNPLEVIFGPIIAPDFTQVMGSIGKWFTLTKSEVNESCGMHVHVCALDYDIFALRRMILMYRRMEELFYGLVLPYRRTKKHSRMYTDAEWMLFDRLPTLVTSGDLRKGIMEAVYEEKMIGFALGNGGLRAGLSHRARQKSDTARYKGLNLHSYFHRGTIEFRHHEGCIDIPRISGWMQLCGWFVELAQRLTDAEVKEIIESPVPSEALMYGTWKREYGLLQLPRDVVRYIQEGPGPAIAPDPVAPRMERDMIMGAAVAQDRALYYAANGLPGGAAANQVVIMPPQGARGLHPRHNNPAAQ